MNQAELEAWGARIGAEVELPIVLALRGPLGAGKSVLARAVARGAGVTEPMPSPTFNLLFEYHSPRRSAVIQHLDLYRLNDPEEVWELGWSDLGHGPSIVMIEWPERAEHLLPPDRWEVTLGAVAGDANERTVHARRVGMPPPLPELP